MVRPDVPEPESDPAGTSTGVLQLNLTFTGNTEVGEKLGADPLQTVNVSDGNLSTGVGFTVTTRSNGVKATQDPALAYTL